MPEQSCIFAMPMDSYSVAYRMGQAAALSGHTLVTCPFKNGIHRKGWVEGHTATPVVKFCEGCGEAYDPKRGRTRFCGRSCANSHNRRSKLLNDPNRHGRGDA